MAQRNPCQFGHVGLLLALALAAPGCAAPGAERDSAVFSYTYLSFNFSGKGWDAARRRCAENGRKAEHQGTTCGFLLCTTQVACVPPRADE